MNKTIRFIFIALIVISIIVLINDELNERRIDKELGCKTPNFEDDGCFLEHSDIELISADFSQYKFIYCGKEIKPTDKRPRIGLIPLENRVFKEELPMNKQTKYLHKIRIDYSFEVKEGNNLHIIKPNCAMVTEINLDKMFMK